MHVLYRLGYLMILLFKELYRSISRFSLSTAFLSIDVIKCDKPMFRGNNRLLHDIFSMLSEGHLRKALWFQCAAKFPAINLGISKGLAVKGLILREHTCPTYVSL
jgi:hypothetical protein